MRRSYNRNSNHEYHKLDGNSLREYAQNNLFGDPARTARTVLPKLAVPLIN